MSIAGSMIRKAFPADARGCATVNLLSWRSAYKGLIAEETLDKLNIDELEKKWVWRFGLDDPAVFCFVAENDEKEIIGYVLCGNNRHTEVAVERELMAIYILDEYRNAGLGKRMFILSVEKFIEQGVNSFVVFALNGNTPTRKFYESFLPDGNIEETIVIDSISYKHTGYFWYDLKGFRFINK